MLAASYAAAHGLEVVTHAADVERYPLEAEQRRDLLLVGESDAAVVMWDESDAGVRRVLELVERKGIPVHVIVGPRTRGKVKRRTRWVG